MTRSKHNAMISEVRSDQGDDSSSDEEGMVMERGRGKSYYDMHKESIFSKKSDKKVEDDDEEEEMTCNKKA